MGLVLVSNWRPIHDSKKYSKQVHTLLNQGWETNGLISFWSKVHYIYIYAFGGFTCPKLTPSTRRCVTQRVKESHIIPIIFQGNGRNKNKGTHMSYI